MPDSADLPDPLNFDGRQPGPKFCSRCLPDDRNRAAHRGAFGYDRLCGPCYRYLADGDGADADADDDQAGNTNE